MVCNKINNSKECNCTYPCTRKGVCCECIAYHRDAGELPACFFSKEAEATYDRSFQNYQKDQNK